MTTSPHVHYDKRGRKACVTLDRPEAMNAMTVEMVRALGAAVRDAVADDQVLVLILTGAGGRAFSAGIDLKEMSRRDGQEKVDFYSLYSGLIDVANCTKPIVAAIDGYCVAAGLELSLRSDIRVATTASKFGLPEPRRSILAGYGLHHLSRMIPLGEALLMQLTGSPITAERAHQIGLVQKLVPDREAMLREAEAIADDIVLCAPLAVQAIKKIVKTGRNLPVEYSYKFAEPIEAAVYASEDRLEGPRAFAEKRAPNWKMR
jgi:enoyl-CoA hydratase/carnithine racemase